MDGGGVSDIPNNGIDNAGLETSPESSRKVFFPPRTSSTLTQVDLDILSAQANVKTGEQQGSSNSNTGEGDPISQVLGVSVVHLDVEDCSEELLQCLLCHKEPARRIQSPLLGALERKKPPTRGFLLAPRWFFMA